MKIDLGCGPRKKSQEYLGIDLFKMPGVDKVVNLEEHKLPFDTNSVDEVYTSHALEHINNLVPLIEEVWRILKPGGKFIVKTPHYKSENAFTDPTHVRLFTRESFHFYDERKVAYKETGWFMSIARFHIDDIVEADKEIQYSLTAKKKNILLVAPPLSIHTRKWKSFLKYWGHSVDVAARTKKGDADLVLGDVTLDKKSQINLFPKKIMRASNTYDVVHANFATRYGHVLEGVVGNTKKILSVWGEDVLDEAENDLQLRDYLIRGLKSADAITTTSEHMAEYLNRNYGVPQTKIWSFPWGYDKDVFFQKNILDRVLPDGEVIPENRKVILSARVCRPQNNIEKIITAFNKVGEDAHLVVLTGDLADAEYLKDLKKKYEHNYRISFLENLNFDELSKVYNLSEATISVPDVDQLATTILESMACGTPIIGSDLAPYKERITDKKTGLIVDNSVGSISDAINFVLTTNFKLANSDAIKNAVSNDSWENNSKTLLKIYDERINIPYTG